MIQAEHLLGRVAEIFGLTTCGKASLIFSVFIQEPPHNISLVVNLFGLE